MSDTKKTELDLELARLTKRIDELLATLTHLKDENRALRARHESLAGERADADAQERAGAHARGGHDRPPEDPGARRLSQDTARVSVRIMEKEYVVACPYEERAALLDAAEFLNGRMREIRDTGKVVGHDRIAVMAALNLAHEFLKGKDRETKDRRGGRRPCTRIARACRGRTREKPATRSLIRQPPLPLQARRAALVYSVLGVACGVRQADRVTSDPN